MVTFKGVHHLLLFVSLYSQLVYSYQNNQTDGVYGNKTIMMFDPCSAPTFTRNIFLASFATAVLVVGTIGNSLTIVVILFSRKLYSHVAYHFIVSMAFADLFISLLITPMKVDMYRHNSSFCHGQLSCRIIFTLDFALTTVSISHLFLIAIDRFIAISKPYFYAAHFTKGKARLIIVFVWLYAATWATLSLFDYHPSSTTYIMIQQGLGLFCYSYKKYFHTISITCIYVIPTILSAFLYSVVLSIAMQHASEIERMKPAAFKKSQPTKYKDMRALKMICIVFAAYTTCWAPNFTFTLLNYWHRKTMADFSLHDSVAYDAVTTIFNNILPVLNSCINPFIYFITSTHFRVAFTDIINRLLKRPRSNHLAYTYVSAVNNGRITVGGGSPSEDANENSF